MKKLFYACALLLILFSFSFYTPAGKSDAGGYIVVQDSVWICNSTTAYAYHSTNQCRGLNRCTHGIIKVSLKDAENIYHRRACKDCY